MLGKVNDVGIVPEGAEMQPLKAGDKLSMKESDIGKADGQKSEEVGLLRDVEMADLDKTAQDKSNKDPTEAENLENQ
jgi:hypothetical protein